MISGKHTAIETHERARTCNLESGHTLTALSPRMSSFFISSATMMSFEEVDTAITIKDTLYVLDSIITEWTSLTVTPSASQ